MVEEGGICGGLGSGACGAHSLGTDKEHEQNPHVLCY